MFGMTTCHWNLACPTLLENINRMRWMQALIHGKFSFFYKQWLVRSSELARTPTVSKPIKSIRSATVTHACAHSFTICLKSVAILNVIGKPAYLVPGSFEMYERDNSKGPFLGMSLRGKILFGETVEKKGRLMATDALSCLDFARLHHSQISPTQVAHRSTLSLDDPCMSRTVAHFPHSSFQ